MGSFVCPMHQDIHAESAGKCPKCGMPLLAQSTRFALVQHLAANPMMLAVMFAAMFALMAGAMLMMR
jgi:hypothetical protein